MKRSTKVVALLVILAILIPAAFVAAQDVWWKGSTSTKDDMTGPITYARLTIYNPTTGEHDPWDGEVTPRRVAADEPANCAAITNLTVSKTLPTDSDYFQICVNGNTAFIMCDTAPATATMVVTTGFWRMLGDGQCTGIIKIEEAACAVIAAATAGNICYTRYY